MPRPFLFYTQGALTDDPERSKQNKDRRLISRIDFGNFTDGGGSCVGGQGQLLISQRRVDESVILADEVRAQYRYNLYH